MVSYASVFISVMVHFPIQTHPMLAHKKVIDKKKRCLWEGTLVAFSKKKLKIVDTIETNVLT